RESGHRRHAVDQPPAGEGRRPGGRTHGAECATTARAHGQCGRSGRCGALPGQSAIRVDHRRGPRRRWRHAGPATPADPDLTDVRSVATTIYQVAARAGVSPATVSRVFNGIPVGTGYAEAV